MNNSELLDSRIDTIESAYEFMLAYAAQGRDTDNGPQGGEIRQKLNEMHQALTGLADVCAEKASERYPDSFQEFAAFLSAVRRDAEVSRSAVSLVLAQSAISSQLIDNLNASIHLRALLTDLFVIDEAIAGS